MNVLKSLWASIEGDPAFMQRLHGWATVVWIFAVPLSFMLRESLMWVVFLSHYAIVTGHWSSWQASRVEVRQDQIEQDRKDGTIDHDAD